VIVGVLLGSIVAVAGSFVWVGGGIDVPMGLGGTGVGDGTAVQAERQIAKITHAMIDLFILLPIRTSFSDITTKYRMEIPMKPWRLIS